jgi:hypothetical protein
METDSERDHQVLSDTLASDVVSIDAAPRYCGVSQHRQQPSAMYSQLRSNNIIVADTSPAWMQATLINGCMALKCSGRF